MSILPLVIATPRFIFIVDVYVFLRLKLNVILLWAVWTQLLQRRQRILRVYKGQSLREGGTIIIKFSLWYAVDDNKRVAATNSVKLVGDNILYLSCGGTPHDDMSPVWHLDRKQRKNTFSERFSTAMLIPTENRKKIYQYLFQEGVLVAKKDFNLPRHRDINVPNLQVIKAMQSLESRELVKTQFSWQFYYYSLTDKGIEYLRKYLHLPVEIVPRTHIKTTKTGLRPRPEGDRPPRDSYRPRGDGEGYRRRDAGEKKEGAGGDFRPEFRGGVGRGGPRPQE